MSRYIVAVEIGSSKIKGALGELDNSGTLHVRGIEEEHQHPNFVRYGHVQNVKEVATELNKVISRLNARIPRAKITGVYVAVGGRSLMTTPARLEETLPDLTEVTPEIVERLLGRARTISPDRELLDVEATEYQVDGKSQGINPVGILGREISARVNLVTIRSQILRNLSLAITEKLGLKINGYVVRPMALSDLILTDEERRLGAMLVDCGAETTTVSIYKKGSLQYLATIPLGSRHITRDLTALPCTEERAETIKVTMGNASPDAQRSGDESFGEIDVTEINNYIRMRAGEIAANVSAQIEYSGLETRSLPCGIILVGGGARLKGLAELLGSETSLPVRAGTIPPSLRISGPKLRPDEDIDIIATLNRLIDAPLKPCVTEPEPEQGAEQANQGRDAAKQQNAAAAGRTSDEDEWTDENDGDDDVEYPKRKGFWSTVFGSIKKSVAPLDEPDEDEFTK